jgi:dCTP deaminase
LDAAQKPEVKEIYIPEHGFILRPKTLYLAHTVEVAGSDHYIPQIDGKSSIGRLGIWTHVTAGRGETGFVGQWTLEIVVVHPVRVYAGMRIAQIFFHTPIGEILNYQNVGHYVREAAKGPVPSMVWRQMAEDSEGRV